MAGRMQHFPLCTGEVQLFPVVQFLNVKLAAKELEGILHTPETAGYQGHDVLVGRMHVHGNLEKFQQAGDAPHMVEMPVCEDNGLGRKAFSFRNEVRRSTPSGEDMPGSATVQREFPSTQRTTQLVSSGLN